MTTAIDNSMPATRPGLKEHKKRSYNMKNRDIASECFSL